MTTDQVIGRCLERCTTAPFLQLICRWIIEQRDLEPVAGIGAAIHLTSDQVTEHIQTAREYCKRMPDKPPKPRLPTGSSWGTRLVREGKIKAEAEKRSKGLAAVIGRLGFGTKTSSRVVDAIMETWKDPERFEVTPAWKALSGPESD
jgi:hypothetical protein